MRRWVIASLVLVVVVVFVGVRTVGNREAGPQWLQFGDRERIEEAPGPVTGDEDDEPIGSPRRSCDDASLGASDPVTTEVDGTVVEPGDSIQEALDEAGEGGTVVVGSGTHVGQSLSPSAGQSIVGEEGAILAGDGAAFAIRSGAPDVTIRGLEITGYAPAETTGVIHADSGGVGWTVEGNHIHSNGEIGVYVRRESTVRANSIHHNGRYGISGRGADLVVTDNTIACNAVDLGPTGDSGGTKFVFTTDLLLEGNQVIANQGNGLWVDINNVDAVVRDNELLDNLLSGIFIEISCGGLVEDNLLEGNSFGSDRPNGVESAAIYIANSPGVTVRNNTLRHNAKGIGAIHWGHPNRDSVDRCSPELRDLTVTKNSIEQNGGIAIGLDTHLDGDAAWDDWGNTFTENTFAVDGETTFLWRDRSLGQDDWQRETSPQGG